MTCRACGTPLYQSEAYCPRCGALTLSVASTNQAAPNDQTVMSNPYEPSYVVPPPPPLSTGRRGKRTGFLIGVILLVLLLIGGGIGIWLVQGAARPSTTATATTTASTKAAVQRFPVKGTSTALSSTSTHVQQDSGNQVTTLTIQQVIYGDIAGSVTEEETDVMHPDKTIAFSGKSSCTCTVAGKSGTLMWSYSGTSAADGTFQGQFFDVYGTNDLARLHGQGTFQGQGTHNTYSGELSSDS
jgi:Protein of unknown function (DUF3224)